MSWRILSSFSGALGLYSIFLNTYSASIDLLSFLSVRHGPRFRNQGHIREGHDLCLVNQVKYLEKKNHKGTKEHRDVSRAIGHILGTQVARSQARLLSQVE